MEQQPHRAMWMNEKKSSYPNWPHILLFDLAHKQYNGIIKG